MDVKIVILSEGFYEKHQSCSELLKKGTRPYYCLTLKLDGVTYGIPLRHHIKHPYGFFTDREAGLDYSKSVIIREAEDISSDEAHIDTKERRMIIRNKDRIFADFSKYVRQYKRALKHRDNPRSEMILRYSTLQFFYEKYDLSI